MIKRYRSILLGVVVLFASCGINAEKSNSADVDEELEEVIRGHVESIGNPGALAGIKVRGISGTALVDFIQGGTGKMSGQALFVSERKRLGIILRYGANEYPGEHFAFDGSEVTVGYISPGQRSPLADFVYRYDGLLKEGLLGGVMSLKWPLLDVDKSMARLKYKGKKKIDGVDAHEVEYRYSDGKMGDVDTKLYFTAETFHHIRTEYIVRIQGEMSLQADASVMESGLPSPSGLTSGSGVRSASIHDVVPDSIYKLVEVFSDFRKVDDMVLPQKYVLEYSVEGQGSTFLANWTIIANQWMHTGKVDASFFRAPEFR